MGILATIAVPPPCMHAPGDRLRWSCLKRCTYVLYSCMLRISAGTHEGAVVLQSTD